MKQAKITFFKRDIYKQLAKNLNTCVNIQKNCLIITVPGLGISHELKKYVKKNETVKYINQPNQKINKYNILDLDFDKNENASQTIDNYFKQATLKQKFCIVLNQPQIISIEKYKKTYFYSHIYATYYFRAYNLEETTELCSRLNSNLKIQQIKQIQKISGGIARLAKYLAVNPDNLNVSLSKLIGKETLKNTLSSTIKTISQCSNQTLEKIKIKKDSKYVSLYLAGYFKRYPANPKIKLEINKDLTFSENDKENKNRLTKPESKILKHLIENQVITREKIAEIKWGKEDYESFSSWAINQTVFRINNKLGLYQLIAIPKVGYKLIEK